MSSRSKAFECLWQPSRRLLNVYILLQAVTLGCLIPLELPSWLKIALVLFCLSHACWVVPRHIRLQHRLSWRGLRWTSRGWQVFNTADGWQAIELHPDSLALPFVVLLRFRLAGQRRVHALCVPGDSLPAHVHRRLRVRLKFSRHRWAVAE